MESASTARNSSSVLLTVKSPFVQEYFALPLLRASPLLFAFLCLCSSARICSTPLRISSYLCLSESSRIQAFAFLCASMPLHCQGQPGLSMPLLCIAERRVSAQRPCDALPPTPRPALPLLFGTTPSLAFAFRHEALHFLCFAYRGKSDPSDLRLSTPLRCAFQLSLASAPRCTAVTTCAPAEQTCQHNAVAQSMMSKVKRPLPLFLHWPMPRRTP